MSGTMTIRSSAYGELIARSMDSDGAVSSAYFEAAKIVLNSIVKQKPSPGRSQSVVDYVCCCDMFLSETLHQLEAQGDEIFSVSQSGHQYTIFFRTVAYG